MILADPDLIGTLKERWIAAEVAKRLDYPIFMAVSERGGKNNSGDYEYLLDEDGSLVEFPDGHPQEGQLVVDQDLVNYDLTAEDLADAANIPDDKLCVAEAFVRFAQEQGFDFWEGGVMAALNQPYHAQRRGVHNRFSAEFFDPKYVFKPNAETAWVPIGRVLKKCEYGISISMNSEGKGFPIFRMNELENCFLTFQKNTQRFPIKNSSSTGSGRTMSYLVHPEKCGL